MKIYIVMWNVRRRGEEKIYPDDYVFSEPQLAHTHANQMLTELNAKDIATYWVHEAELQKEKGVRADGASY